MLVDLMIGLVLAFKIIIYHNLYITMMRKMIYPQNYEEKLDLQDRKTQAIDEKRVKNYENLMNLRKRKDAEEEKMKIKQPIKMHKFREEARKQQRQMNQATHEFIKIAQNLTESIQQSDRFKFLTSIDGGSEGKKYSNTKQKTTFKQKPTITLHLEQTQMQSHLSSAKVSMKALFEKFPFKNQSIEMEPSNITDPKFEFFIFQQQPESRKEILHRLQIQNTMEESVVYQLRTELRHQTKYVDFFDFIYLINKEDVQPIMSEQRLYPAPMLQIARNTYDYDLSKNNDQIYQVKIPDLTTTHRVIQCENLELYEPNETIYFPYVSDYTNYKKLREIDFKMMEISENQKVYDNDLFINTDVRNIISSQKIYLIQIGEEMVLLIKISKEVKELSLMKSIYDDMIGKIDQYLRLTCGYTESIILKQYNIDNPYDKIRTFIEKSIKYDKEYVNPKRQVLDKFPVLQIWYRIPKKKFGCQIHQPLYELIKATIELQKRIKYEYKLRQLKSKKSNINYDIGTKK